MVYGSACRLLIKKELFSKIQFNKNIKISEDLLITLQLISIAANPMVIDGYYYIYDCGDNVVVKDKYYNKKHLIDRYNLVVGLEKVLRNFDINFKYLLKSIKFSAYYGVCKCYIYDDENH